MARVTRLELAASGVTGRRSNQLSYTRMVCGAVFSSRSQVVQVVFRDDFQFSTPFLHGWKPTVYWVRKGSVFECCQPGLICVNGRNRSSLKIGRVILVQMPLSRCCFKGGMLPGDGLQVERGWGGAYSRGSA